MKTVEFFFDIYSPYAYLAANRLIEIAGEKNCKISYKPIDLINAKRAAGNTGPSNMEIPPKIKYLMTDLKRWADRYQLPFGVIPKGFNSARINQGVFFAVACDRADEYVKEAYRLVWGEGGDPNSDELLSALAINLDFNVTEFMDYINSDETAQLYQNGNDEAVERGVFGVPMMVVDDNMWWGNDRLHFVEDYIG